PILQVPSLPKSPQRRRRRPELSSPDPNRPRCRAPSITPHFPNPRRPPCRRLPLLLLHLPPILSNPRPSHRPIRPRRTSGLRQRQRRSQQRRTHTSVSPSSTPHPIRSPSQ